MEGRAAELLARARRGRRSAPRRPSSCCSAIARACRGAARAAASAPGGAARAAHARVVAADRRAASSGWISARREALRRGARDGTARAAGGARALALSTRSRRSCSRPATTPRCSTRSPRCRAPLAPGAPRRRRHEHARLPALRADPFCVPELDASSQTTRSGSTPTRSRCCRRSASSTPTPPDSSRSRPRPTPTLDVPGLGGELKPFQRAGVSYLLAQRRAFLADEQGLGKTIEALATLEADGAYPAIVVCPASLKLNWLRELERWLPGRSAQMLAGTAARRGPTRARRHHGRQLRHRRRAARRAARAGAAGARARRVPLLQERRAKRTQAVQPARRGGAARRPRARAHGHAGDEPPAELISQLRILGRLEDFGSGAQFGTALPRPRRPPAPALAPARALLRAAPEGRRAAAAAAEDARGRAGRARQRARVPPRRARRGRVAAQPAARPARARREGRRGAARRAARAAERAEAARRARQAPRRARLDPRLPAPPASGWSCSPTTARSSAPCSSASPARCTSSARTATRARDAALRAFQEPDGAGNQLIVCSIEVAGQGITLTRSSNVAFLELDWTPAKHDQAEDRCHRIGQQDAVNATYLLAADTIDETIATLLERKRAVIGAVTDGRDRGRRGASSTRSSRELRGEPYRHLRAVA